MQAGLFEYPGLWIEVESLPDNLMSVFFLCMLNTLVQCLLTYQVGPWVGYNSYICMIIGV